MNRRKTLAIILLAIAILIVISVPIWLFTPLGANVLGNANDPAGPPLTPLTYTPMPKAIPQAVLTPRGAPGSVLASGSILMDADSGTILYEKDAVTPVPMASTTKIMTALVAMRVGKLDQMITIGQDAINQDGIGSSAGLYLGEHISLKDLLYGLLLPSGDDAAVAIADGVAGSQDAFVHIMNTEAQRLHLFQTHFYDPTGLDTDQNLNPIPANQHYTTPYDLVRLARYAMSIPLFAQIVKTKTYTPAPHSSTGTLPWKNTNSLLKSYQGTLGINTGWTGTAGGCLVFAARRHGHTLIGVVLHSTDPAREKAMSDPQRQILDEQLRTADASTLLDWGFSLPVQMPQV